MRPTRVALVAPLLLPFLAASLSLADDAPKPDAPKPDAPKAEPAKPDGAKVEAPKPSAAMDGDPKKAADTIAWVHDYDAAKTKAAAEKKGLFVYLTPAWFT